MARPKASIRVLFWTPPLLKGWIHGSTYS